MPVLVPQARPRFVSHARTLPVSRSAPGGTGRPLFRAAADASSRSAGAPAVCVSCPHAARVPLCPGRNRAAAFPGCSGCQFSFRRRARGLCLMPARCPCPALPRAEPGGRFSGLQRMPVLVPLVRPRFVSRTCTLPVFRSAPGGTGPPHPRHLCCGKAGFFRF